MQNLNETLKQLDQLQYNYGKVGNTMTKEEYKAEFKRIAKMTEKTQSKVNDRVKEYEGYLASYIGNSTKESLEEVKHRFEGDFWINVNIPSIVDANLDPYALKEAYLKACDFHGVERPNGGRFVEETEAKLYAPFWETGVNPLTMTKVHDTYDWVEDEKNTVDYSYEF